MSRITPKNNLREIEQFACSLVKEAGEFVKARRNGNTVDVSFNKNDIERDVVTSADMGAEELLINAIRKEYPDHRIFAEETAGKLSAKDFEGPLWVLDPIDGTVNFVHHHLFVAVSVAFAFDGEVQVGVVGCPFLGETFSAVKGQGATLNGSPISVSAETVLKRSLIATGFPYDRSNLDYDLDRVRRLLSHCQDIRRCGSAAADLCWVGAGRLDGYAETIATWDLAAGGLIAREAGARMGHSGPVPGGIPPDLCGDKVVVTTPGIYDSLVAALTE